jgi:hypothetical protein
MLLRLSHAHALFGPVAVSFLVHYPLDLFKRSSLYSIHLCCVNLRAWLTGLTAVWAACVLCRCHVMTWGDCPTSAGLAGVGSTSPAWGRPVAHMLLYVLAAFVYDFR